MKAWITCFFLVFVLAKLGLWLKGFILPLPLYILGGAFLAIASNVEAMPQSHPLTRAVSLLNGLKPTEPDVANELETHSVNRSEQS